MVNKLNPQPECSYCGGEMYIERMRCGSCLTAVDGQFKLSTFADLSGEEQDFVHEFILSSGSLKEMAEKLEISYPTVRKKLDTIIKKLQQGEAEKQVRKSKQQRVIELAEKGKISVQAADEIVKEIL
jgi:hypothetical protein